MLTHAAIPGLTLITCLGMILAATPPPARAESPPADDVQPSPQLAPEDVISRQVAALSTAGQMPSRIERCYRFASPANRVHTGPMQRFENMIRSPSYSPLLEARRFLVGRAVKNGREAHLLLTVVDSQGRLSLFRCFLSKQSDAPYAECWMTDAVLRAREVAPPQGPPPPAQPLTPSI